MNDREMIEEMAKIICDGCHNGKCVRGFCADWYRAERLYNAGYRKQKQGKWIVTERGCVITCSNCKERVELYYPDGTPTGLLPYCPYCGSKNKEN